MPIYTPKFTEQPFKSGKNILASEHLQYIEGGATLDATKFGAKYVECGTAIARNKTTGKFEPYKETTAGTLESGFDEFAILDIDWDCDGKSDGVVGQVIVRGSVYEAKLVGVTDAFKKATTLIRYVRHI
ncbi:hypothetical protein [Bacillus gaemokensis]|uniref:Head decoration protein n=1 Tax=Bacillus gaemokensis TaxID=574375 RepID=A0A073K7I1_9BACI|nr:hypothetical protein [Bacillus gaemokensis]KEK22476.1 hypothetical protein BAGA_18895 [Bacillus gaemokensis]KYG28829.1 hypothetical protein AZF08_13980 [Bacillus gaemokensis]